MPSNHTATPHSGHGSKIKAVAEPAMGIARQKPASLNETHSAVVPDATIRMSQSLPDALPVLIFILDADKHFSYSNGASQNWFGFERDQLIGLHLEEVIGSPAWQAAVPRIDDALRDGEVEFECAVTSKSDGERQVQAHLSVRPGPDGTRTEILVFMTDITRRKAMERSRRFELDQALEALEATIEGAPDSVLVMDPSGVIQNANSSAERLFGTPAEKLLGQSLNTFLPASDMDDFTEFFEEAKLVSPDIRSTKPRQSLLRKADGSLAPIEVAIGVHPRLDHFTAFIRDISIRRSLESEVLHVAVDERRRIAQDLHDSLCQEISAAHFAVSALAGRLASIHAVEAGNAKKISGMLEETLDHARQIAHGLAPVMEEGDDLVRALVRLARKTEDLCGLDCRVHAASSLAGLGRDIGSQIYYIAQEAISNVLRHAHATRIQIEISRSAEELVLFVNDDGRGLVSTEKTEGRGLRFMRYRTESVNGTLRIRSRPQGGTQIECRVPVSSSRQTAFQKSP